MVYRPHHIQTRLFLLLTRGMKQRKQAISMKHSKKKKRKRNEKSTVIIQTYLPMFDTNLQESKIVFNV